jgi:hypothetical protein
MAKNVTVKSLGFVVIRELCTVCAHSDGEPKLYIYTQIQFTKQK